MDKSTRYVVITPVRDEESHVEATIACMARQTILPQEWVVVNDGSSDRTGEILDRWARELPWLRIVHRPNRGYRKSGGGVVEAFYDGYNALRCADWEFIVKLDGDLSLAPDYFERCFERFVSTPRLGIAGGGIYHETAGQLRIEENPAFHVRGATKIYQRDCWEAIGGLWPAPGWDTIDEVKANMLGWKTRTFRELRVLHHRVTGSADGFVRNNVKRGIGCYIAGYHPLFVAASCCYRLARRPVIIGSAAICYGFLKGYVRRLPQVSDKRVIRYIREQQLRRLCGAETIWR